MTSSPMPENQPPAQTRKGPGGDRRAGTARVSSMRPSTKERPALGRAGATAQRIRRTKRRTTSRCKKE
eukprot:6835990-Lingulodinium_polyedra.AAC.1